MPPRREVFWVTKVLVTGGLGFIGAEVSKQLLDAGAEVVILDSFASYFPLFHEDAGLYQRFVHDRVAPLNGRVQLERGDTRHKDELRRVMLKHRPDRVIHLAALPLANVSTTYSEEAIGSIVAATTNLLEVVRDLDHFERFVYASSSMVYGEFVEHPATESHPTHPKNIYGGAKLCGEVVTRTYGEALGIEYAIVRPSAVYGPTDVNRRVVQIFVENALRGRPLVLKGGASNALDFTYVKDIASGFVKAALVPAAANETFNITRGEGRTLGELVGILREIIGDIEVEEAELDHIIPRRGALDTSRARQILGFESAYALEDGVREYVEFVRSYLET